MALHAQRKGFQTEVGKPRGLRRRAEPKVAGKLKPCLGNIGAGGEILYIDKAVVRLVRLRQSGIPAVFRPVKAAAVHNRAAHAGAVAAQVLGQRVHDDVGAKLEGAQQIGRGHGVVHDQRHAVGVGHIGQRLNVGHVAQRVADGFDEHGLGLGIDQLAKAGRIARVGKAHLNALLREGVGKQVVGAAVERAGADDVVAGFGQCLNRRGDGGHARCHGQRGNAALQCRHALFQHIGGGVHDAGVDIARHLQVKQVGAMLGAVERVGHCLVDGDGAGFGGGVRGVAGMNGEGFNAHECVSISLVKDASARGRGMSPAL